MLFYIARRLALIPVTLLGISLLIFTLTRFLPGGPLDLRVAQELATAAANSPVPMQALSEEQMQVLRVYYGLDKPLPVAYGHWLWALLHGDLGVSLRYQEPVWDLMLARLPVSLMFGAGSLICAYGFCLLFGLWFAMRPGQVLVRISQGILLLFHSIPSSIMAMALFFFCAASGAGFPLGGLTSDDFQELSPLARVVDILHHATLPLFAYCSHELAMLSFLLRDTLQEQLQSEVMQMARAKGASQSQALWSHALPLSLIPLISQLGQQFGLILAGSFLIERIFNLNGFGLLTFEAMIERDYPLVIGLLTIAATLHVFGNFIADLCLSWADPRIRWRRISL